MACSKAPSRTRRWPFAGTTGPLPAGLEDVPLTGLGARTSPPLTCVTRSPSPPRKSAIRTTSGSACWSSLARSACWAACSSARAASGALRGLAPAPPHTPTPEPLTAARTVPAAIAFLLVHALFSGTDFGAPGVGLVWAQDIAFTWLLALVVATWLLAGLLADTRRATWVAAGLCAAILGVLLHSVLDFGLLTAGGLSVFVLTAVAAAGVFRTSRPLAVELPARTTWAHAPRVDRRRRRRRTLASRDCPSSGHGPRAPALECCAARSAFGRQSGRRWHCGSAARQRQSGGIPSSRAAAAPR